VYLDLFFLVSLTGLVGVRSRTLHKPVKETRKKKGIGFGDDSGSKLRDKEQQRLSSK